MKLAYPLFLSLAAASVHASEFRNLSFDEAAFDLSRPPLDAGLAERYLPNWQTSTGLIGYNYTQPFGGLPSLISGNYRNTSQTANPSKLPVIGTLALGIWPATSVGDFPTTISQAGEIPIGSQSLRFLYHGDNLKVYVGGIERVVRFVEARPSGNPEIGDLRYYAVDVGLLAGQTAELKFEFRSFGNFPGMDGGPIIGWPDAKFHVLDDLSFSPLPAVPEPQTWVLLAGGLGLAGWWSRQRSA